MRRHFDPFSHVRLDLYSATGKKDRLMIPLLSLSVRKLRGGRSNYERHLERKPTEGNDSFQLECRCFRTVGDFLKRSSLLNIFGDKGDNRTGPNYGYGKPDDAPKWPAKTVLSPH